MRWRIITLAASLLLLPMVVSAVDLSSIGLTVISRTSEGDRTRYETEDEAGNRIIVVASGTLTQRQADHITEAKNALFGWSTMDASYIRVTPGPERTSILLVPSRYSYQGINFTEYLPSGMQFYIDKSLEYDFRIQVDRIFIRIQGFFTDEQRFNSWLASAVKDPAGFIERNDPEYVVRLLRDFETRIEDQKVKQAELSNLLQQTANRLESTNAELDSTNAELDSTRSELNTKIDSTAGELESIIETAKTELESADNELASNIREANDRITELRSDVEDIYQEASDAFQAFYNEYLDTKAEAQKVAEDYFELKEDYGELKTDYEAMKLSYQQRFDKQGEDLTALREMLDTLRYAFVAERNRGLFTGPRPVEDWVAQRIIEIKEANPEYSEKEIASVLSEEEIDVSRKGIRLVLLVYMGIVE